MRHLFLAFIVAAAVVIADRSATAAPFTIVCQTLNADTQQPQTTFHPGDHILVSVTATFNDADAANKKLDISADAKATIAGITVPYSLTLLTGAPNNDPRAPGTSLFHSGTEMRVFSIPSPLPNSSVSLKIKANIAHVGKASCTSAINIIN